MLKCWITQINDQTLLHSHLRQPAQAGKPPQVYVHDSDNAAVADIACVRQSNKQNSVFWNHLM